MEYGFYHHDIGYWQSTGGELENLLSSYPNGTINIPLKPSGDHIWQDGSWVYVEPPPVDLGAEDQARLNAALTAEGSVVRALGLVLFEAINAQNLVTLDAVNELRDFAGLPLYSVNDFRQALAAKAGQDFYTMQEFLDALQAQMRSS